jgi:hypothetical protein
MEEEGREERIVDRSRKGNKKLESVRAKADKEPPHS